MYELHKEMFPNLEWQFSSTIVVHYKMNSRETSFFGDDIRARPRNKGALAGWLSFFYSSRSCLNREIPPHIALQALLCSNDAYIWNSSCEREMEVLGRFSGVTFEQVRGLFSSASHDRLAPGVISFTPCGCLTLCFCTHERAGEAEEEEEDDSQATRSRSASRSGHSEPVSEGEFLAMIEEEYADQLEDETSSTTPDDSSLYVDSSIASTSVSAS